jgi:hypothetical protein
MRALKLSWVIAGLFVSLVVNTVAQQRVNLRNTYERLLCVVPMVGAGTYEDPRRPKYAPTGPLHNPQLAPIDEAQPGREDLQPLRKGILGFSFVLSDDEQFALVEFVAASKADFKEIVADASVKAFVKGKARRLDIESEFRRFKADIDLDKLEVSVP